MWQPQWDALTERWRTIRVDLRGFGESDLRPNEPFAHHADLAALLDELDAGPAHLVGCSLGAGIVAEVALARPDLVASILLVSPAGALLAEPSDDLRQFWREEGDALERGDLDAAVEVNLRTWVDGPTRRSTAVDPTLPRDRRRDAAASVRDHGRLGRSRRPRARPRNHRSPTGSSRYSPPPPLPGRGSGPAFCPRPPAPRPRPAAPPSSGLWPPFAQPRGARRLSAPAPRIACARIARSRRPRGSPPTHAGRRPGRSRYHRPGSGGVPVGPPVFKTGGATPA